MWFSEEIRMSSGLNTHAIHVWYTSLQLPSFHGKCIPYMDCLGYDFNVVIPSVAWLDSNQAATADAIKGSECKVLAKCEAGKWGAASTSQNLRQLKLKMDTKLTSKKHVLDWKGASFHIEHFGSEAFTTFMFAFHGISRPVDVQIMLIPAWADRNRVVPPEFTLTSWHRPVRGGMWTWSVEERPGSSNMILIDSPWSHATSQCCFKEQSMQMSALGYPDEVCMIPEEEW